MIRLLFADDQALVRAAMAALLGMEDDLTVVAEVGRGDEVAAAAREHAAVGRAGYLRQALAAGADGFVVKDNPGAVVGRRGAPRVPGVAGRRPGVGRVGRVGRSRRVTRR